MLLFVYARKYVYDTATGVDIFGILLYVLTCRLQNAVN
jgi:hypothetical protein